uniref:Ankyrin repeat domain n=1 Tax=Clandestinovirus TaxID=2831644 RepID=A0A8F8PMZ4_9VIRU|nr:ankyrin repeat domain [Clandestinovirus]
MNESSIVDCDDLQSHWCYLPYELLRLIAKLLSPQEVVKCFSVAKGFLPFDNRDKVTLRCSYYKVMARAAKVGDIDVVKQLYEGLDPSIEANNIPHSHKGRLVIGNCYDNTLAQAAQYGNKPIFEFLINRGHSPSAQVLNVALSYENYDIAESICEKFPSCVEDWIINNQAAGGNVKTMDFLERYGADASELAVTNAARSGNLAIVKWLNERGIRGDEWSVKYAIAFGHDEVAQFLYEQQGIPLPVE